MTNQTEPNQPFNKIILQSIDEVLAAIGEPTKNIVFLFLSKQKGINREQIPDRLEEFDAALKFLFGAGAVHIERCLVELMEDRIGIKCPMPLDAGSFLGCLVYLRQQYGFAGLFSNSAASKAFV